MEKVNSTNMEKRVEGGGNSPQHWRTNSEEMKSFSIIDRVSGTSVENGKWEEFWDKKNSANIKEE